MKKIRRLFKGLILSYYTYKMNVYAEKSEIARIEYGEESEENLKCLRYYNHYSKKYDETLLGAY